MATPPHRPSVSYDHGYVGQVLDALRRHDGRVWRAVNLSQSGALAIDVVEEQLPGLDQIGAPDLVSCAVGSNDLLRRTTTFEAALAEIARALPVGALLANLPRGLRERRAQQVNGYIERVAREHRLRLVDLWSTTGPPWRDKFSADRFHPNEVGYRDWTTAFCAALGIK
ncbi:MAG: GDSL-type esterase/lipase family protein [Acidimicrobiia bacterium]